MTALIVILAMLICISILFTLNPSSRAGGKFTGQIAVVITALILFGLEKVNLLQSNPLLIVLIIGFSIYLILIFKTRK